MLIRKVYIPQLMPYLMSAFRYSFGMTWKIVALSETFGIKFGIGYMFFFWFENFDMEQVLAWVLLFVILMADHRVRRHRPLRAARLRLAPHLLRRGPVGATGGRPRVAAPHEEAQRRSETFIHTETALRPRHRHSRETGCVKRQRRGAKGQSVIPVSLRHSRESGNPGGVRRGRKGT